MKNLNKYSLFIAPLICTSIHANLPTARALTQAISQIDAAKVQCILRYGALSESELKAAYIQAVIIYQLTNTQRRRFIEKLLPYAIAAICTGGALHTIKNIQKMYQDTKELILLEHALFETAISREHDCPRVERTSEFVAHYRNFYLKKCFFNLGITAAYAIACMMLSYQKMYLKNAREIVKMLEMKLNDSLN